MYSRLGREEYGSVHMSIEDAMMALALLVLILMTVYGISVPILAALGT